jgi:hypothetical protein
MNSINTFSTTSALNAYGTLAQVQQEVLNISSIVYSNTFGTQGNHMAVYIW